MTTYTTTINAKNIIATKVGPRKWTAWHKGLGILAHGKSAKGAAERMAAIMVFMFVALLERSGPSVAHKRFDREDVKLDLKVDGIDMPADVLEFFLADDEDTAEDDALTLEMSLTRQLATSAS